MIRPILVSTAFIILTTSASADTINVYQGESIQSAINGATEGDEIVVGPGTYHETVDLLGKMLTLRSSDGADVTTIDATGLNDAAVSCENGEPIETKIDGFTITGGTGSAIGANTHGGGMYIHTSFPTVANCVFTGNTAAAGGGLAAVNMTQGTIENCTFVGNTATAGGFYGGGGMYLQISGPDVLNCRFLDNEAIGAAKGGGVSIFIGWPRLENCVVYGNSARHGGGIMNDQGSPTITNCTIAANTAVSTGGAMRSLYDSSKPIVTNSIFWGNTAGTTGDEVLDQAGTLSTIDYSTVQGGWAGAGANNASSDPQFADMSGGDLHLDASSPCVDAGNNAVVIATTDLDGNDRIFDSGVVDLGAFEDQGGGETNPCLADFDTNGTVGFDDLMSLLFAWGSCSGCPEDLNGDDLVEFNDLLMLLQSWGACP